VSHRATETDAHATGLNGEVILEAGRAERHYWRDLWTYRELLPSGISLSVTSRQ
jgi:hypothetical protein